MSTCESGLACVLGYLLLTRGSVWDDTVFINKMQNQEL